VLLLDELLQDQLWQHQMLHDRLLQDCHAALAAVTPHNCKQGCGEADLASPASAAFGRLTPSADLAFDEDLPLGLARSLGLGRGLGLGLGLGLGPSLAPLL